MALKLFGRRRLSHRLAHRRYVPRGTAPTLAWPAAGLALLAALLAAAAWLRADAHQGAVASGELETLRQEAERARLQAREERAAREELQRQVGALNTQVRALQEELGFLRAARAGAKH